jgi:hypothetical protein
MHAVMGYTISSQAMAVWSSTKEEYEPSEQLWVWGSACLP